MVIFSYRGARKCGLHPFLNSVIIQEVGGEYLGGSQQPVSAIHVVLFKSCERGKKIQS